MSALGYKVWVGCLACYNDGKLLGEWFDAADAPTSGYEFHERMGKPACSGFAEEPHEELWVFDHENSPVDGEYSPMQAVEYAEILDDGDIDTEEEFSALMAYIKHLGIEFGSSAIDDFRDAYQGQYDSDEDFAYQLAEDLGQIDHNASWPNSYIDWERAARDLMMDYFEEDHHYFRA